jgi:hypothetical protein
MPLLDPTTIPNHVVSEGGVTHVNAIFDRLQAQRVDQMQIAESGSGFRLSSMIRAYTQAHLRRSLMFIEGARDEFFSGRGLVALASVRAIFENVAAYCDFERQLQTLVSEGDIRKIHGFVRSRAFATRKENLIEHAGTDAVRAINILTQIDKMKPLRASYRDDYDHLCELTHPNGLGALVYFQSFGGEQDVGGLSCLP